MTSNEIKEELRNALSKDDIIDRAYSVLVVFQATFKSMMKDDNFQTNPQGLFKLQYYKWDLVCNELIKDGFDIPRDLFVFLSRISDGEGKITKAMGWDKIKMPEHDLIRALQSIILVQLTLHEKGNMQ